MVLNNINGSLNKWANIDWREKGHHLLVSFLCLLSLLHKRASKHILKINDLHLMS